MLENLLNGQFGKSAVIWHYLVPRVVAYNNSQLSCKYLCGYTFLFFYDFLMYSLIFMNMQICSLAYFTAEWSCYVLLLFFIELVL